MTYADTMRLHNERMGRTPAPVCGEMREVLRRAVCGLQTPMMNGDNLSIVLCGAFENADQDEDGDTGWTPDAVAGWTEVTDAIVDAAIAALTPHIAAEIAAAYEAGKASAREGWMSGIDCDAIVKQAALDAKHEERRLVIQWLLNGISGGAKMPSAIATSIAHGAHLSWQT